MKKNNLNITILEPEEGYYLTQKIVKEGECQMFWSKLYLGKNDSPDNYKEISIEEGNSIKALQESSINEEE